MQYILWVIGFIASVAFAFFFIPEGESKIADSVALVAGIMSLSLSVKVICIAHNTKQHILSKVSMGEIRELHGRFANIDMSPSQMETAHINEAREVIGTALECPYSPDKQISKSLKACMSYLEESSPKYEIFMQKLGYVVKLLNLC